MGQYIVFNIGCIECGVSSAIVGVFDSEAVAEQWAADLNKRLHWREGGQNSYEVFPMPEFVNKVAAEYLPEGAL